jgi:hypothetical protein
MAHLRKQILGKVSGKFGDIVFRNTKRKNYISSRPVSYNTPMDEMAINRRGRFAISGKFASLISSVPDLRYFWELEKPADTRLVNYLIKKNFNLVNPDGLSEVVSLTPSLGWIAEIENFEMNDTEINVLTKPLGNRTGIDLEVEKHVRMFAVISLSSPVDIQYDKTMMIPLNSDLKQLSLTDSLSFQIPITNQIQDLMSKYQKRIILYAFVTYDLEGKPVSYSRTMNKR